MVPHAGCPWLDVHRSDDPSGVPVIDHTGVDDGEPRRESRASVEPSDRPSERTLDLPDPTTGSDE